MADAAQLYAAFRSVCPVDENGDLLLPLEQLEDGGRGWFAIANAVNDIAAPATDTTEPYEVELVPIASRMGPDGLEIQESEDERPTKITIRAYTAADFCVAQMDDRFEHAVFAHAIGIDLETVEWRMDPGDVQGGNVLCNLATGEDASNMCRTIYFEGGGKQQIANVPEFMLGKVKVGSDAGWNEVARTLLTEFDGSVARVRCRTPGVGILTIGPIRAGHMRLHTGTAARENEWKGRLAALAKACDRSLGLMLSLRPEDAVHAWGAFDALKKKAGPLPSTAIGARLSATFSRGPDSKTSTS